MNYRFSAGIVYNNFQWPLAATAEQRQAIEEAAQAVLDVRVKYPVSSLADHLNGTMPPDLFKARQKLDAAVDAAFSKKKFSSDTDYVAFLFELYQQILPGMIAPALLDAAAAGLKRPAMRRKRLYQIKRTDCAFARLRRYRDILQNARHPRNVTSMAAFASRHRGSRWPGGVGPLKAGVISGEQPKGRPVEPSPSVRNHADETIMDEARGGHRHRSPFRLRKRQPASERSGRFRPASSDWRRRAMINLFGQARGQTRRTA